MIEKDPLQALWKSQTEKTSAPLINNVKLRATRFQSTIRWRNASEYVAALLVAGMFGWMAVQAEHAVVKSGAVLIILAAGFVCYQLHVKARATARHQLDMAVSLIEFHCAELRRQRDALSSVWRWYIAPFMPGILLYILGNQFVGRTSESLSANLLASATKLAIVAAILYVIHWLNQREARKLDREIAELESQR